MVPGLLLRKQLGNNPARSLGGRSKLWNPGPVFQLRTGFDSGQRVPAHSELGPKS